MLRAKRIFYAALTTIGVAVTSLTGAWAQSGDQVDPTFKSFIAAGNFEAANMYIKGGFVKAESQDTSQIFFSVFMEQYSKELRKNAGQIDALYQYLNAISPISFNRTFRCGHEDGNICTFASNIMSGAGRDTIDYFIQRGLDLNYKSPGIVPATVPLIARLGSVYSLEDLNYFVSKGLVLGADLYPIEELAAYRDSHLNNNSYPSGGLNIPVSLISASNLNLLDLLVVSLGTESTRDQALDARRQRLLCEFTAHAAPSFQPSFDYLQFLLEARRNFRPANVGKMTKVGGGVYESFPGPCDVLIQNMIASHGDLRSIIQSSVTNGDTETANWLMTVHSSKN